MENGGRGSDDDSGIWAASRSLGCSSSVGWFEFVMILGRSARRDDLGIRSAAESLL